MPAATMELTHEIAEVPGRRRLLGHALEFRNDPLRLFQRALAGQSLPDGVRAVEHVHAERPEADADDGAVLPSGGPSG
jgi:hypothetical protein